MGFVSFVLFFGHDVPRMLQRAPRGGSVCVSINTIPSGKSGEDREKWRLSKHPNVQCVGLNNSAAWSGGYPFSWEECERDSKVGFKVRV